MGQQQFKIKWSVGTKLLIGGVLLLAVVIGILNVSAILLIREDKKAYIYEAQGTEAVLAGREFANTAKRVIDTLRLSLALIDPARPAAPVSPAGLKSIVENQSDASWISLNWLETKTGQLRSVVDASNEKELKRLAVSSFSGGVGSSLPADVLEQLRKHAFTFINLSTAGEMPLLGVIVADPKAMGAAGVPVALAIVPLVDYAKQLGRIGLTIATRQGRVLFDTDPGRLTAKRIVTEDPLFQAALAGQTATAALEYAHEGRRYIGSYVNTGMDLVVLDRLDWGHAMKASYALSQKFVLQGLMAIAIAMILTILFSKTLTAPINRLYEATGQVAAGNFNLELKPDSQDEIGALTASFDTMSKQISELIQEKMKKVQIENEMKIAATVQQTLIPPPVFENENILIHSYYQAATECGGDWWGFIGAGKKMTLMIADATGHGLPSALMTASARSCMSVMQKLAVDDPAFTFSPSAILAYANRVIYEASLGQIMMTFFVATIDFETMTLTYANAGQTPPWLCKKDATGKYKIHSLVAAGQRLGEARDAAAFEERSIAIAPEDILFLYTDGLLEGKDLGGTMFGKKRSRQLVEQHVAEGGEKLLQAIVKDFGSFNAGKAFDDDVTLAAALIRAPGQAPAAKPAPIAGGNA